MNDFFSRVLLNRQRSANPRFSLLLLLLLAKERRPCKISRTVSLSLLAAFLTSIHKRDFGRFRWTEPRGRDEEWIIVVIIFDRYHRLSYHTRRMKNKLPFRLLTLEFGLSTRWTTSARIVLRLLDERLEGCSAKSMSSGIFHLLYRNTLRLVTITVTTLGAGPLKQNMFAAQQRPRQDGGIWGLSSIARGVAIS